MKTQEELKALKEEAEMMTRKLAVLSEEELAQVAGGDASNLEPGDILPNIVLPGDGTLNSTRKSALLS